MADKMSEKTNALNWFEIPATDMARAVKFYSAVFDVKMEQMNMMGMDMAFFPAEDGNGKVSGGLAQSNFHKPSADGVIVYLNANPAIQTILDRIEGNGGKVVMPKTLISEHLGYMAFFMDTEGNRIGLHASN